LPPPPPPPRGLNVFANEYIKKRARSPRRDAPGQAQSRARRAATRPDKPNRPASAHSLRQN